MAVLVALTVTACSGGSAVAAGVDAYTQDGTITDGELEQAWKLAEECLEARGIEATADTDPNSGAWGVSIGGDHDQADYEECSEVSQQVTRLHIVEHAPTGAARLEMAQSVLDCWAEVGVVGIAFDPAYPDESRMMAEVIEQLGYDQRLQNWGERPEVDQRFLVVSRCLDRYLLLLWPNKLLAP